MLQLPRVTICPGLPYCESIWRCSVHTRLIDNVLNDALPIVLLSPEADRSNRLPYV